MRQVRHLLEDKGDAVYSVAPEAPVLDAIRMMAERGVGYVLDEHPPKPRVDEPQRRNRKR